MNTQKYEYDSNTEAQKEHCGDLTQRKECVKIYTKKNGIVVVKVTYRKNIEYGES